MNAKKSIVMMKTNIYYRSGRALSRVRQGWLRLQNQTSARLAKKGVPAPLAKWLPRLITLLILVGLFFIFKPLLSGLAMVLGALLALLFAAVLLANGSPSKNDSPVDEWKLGTGGFGLYRGDIRIDAGDPPGEED